LKSTKKGEFSKWLICTCLSSEQFKYPAYHGKNIEA